ncbi:DUF1330 domain-containing protein [Caballeronia humi]|uniref:DUF1330 domain-containing protein n=1 Tax=Caballeronia humi TaxID=326474 RepID=A0A158IMK4_9BURK|nr:DUF1330 domain-containing protein [Caballeronia humi]SAL57613.1 hypothetical protein AWB65_05067 [Caballeronia humi]
MKGYWLILGSNVEDHAAQERYAALWEPIAARYQASVRMLDVTAVLQEARSTKRVLAVEFPSIELARACYEDPAYQEAMPFALKASYRELLIIEGDLA